MMYLINSPIQMHLIGVAEKNYPQAMVLVSSLNSIFSNFGIALGSATGGFVVNHFGVNNVGSGGAVYTLITLIAIVSLNRSNKLNKNVSTRK